VLFDACRNSFFSGAISGLSSGRTSRALVQPTVTRANVLVSFSTQAGTKAEDDVNGGEHSPYAIALSENLKNNRDIRLVMGSIRTRVYGLTANQQYPIEKNMLDGKDYCLSGFCKQNVVIDDSENKRLRKKIARLEQQQNVYVAPEVAEVRNIGDENQHVFNSNITQESTSKWINPLENVCKSNGGEINGNICDANWENAKKICKLSGGTLPSIRELKKVIVDCGGSFNNRELNHKNAAYKSCYKEKGFTSVYDTYWSSTKEQSSSSILFVHFYNGTELVSSQTGDYSVRCVRDRN